MLSRQPRSLPQSMLMWEMQKALQRSSSPASEADGEGSAAAKEASESAAPEAADAGAAEVAEEKPKLDVQSAPSAAEKLEQEIAATAQQV